MEQEVERLRGSLAAVGCEDWLLPPASSDEIAEVVDAVSPHFLPDELIELWSLHAGIKVESRASERFLGWSAPAQVLRRRAHWTDLGESYSYPSVWPYWNGDRWLPIAAADRNTLFVVLGDKPFRQSVVGVHSSSTLDIRVQQSSLRSWVMGLDLVIGGLAVESALAGFRSGQTPFISVLEAHNALYSDRRQHAELLFHILWHSALLDAFGMERQTS